MSQPSTPLSVDLPPRGEQNSSRERARSPRSRRLMQVRGVWRRSSEFYRAGARARSDKGRRQVDFDAAIQEATDKLNENPKNVEARMLRASALVKKGDSLSNGAAMYSRAIGDFTVAIKSVGKLVYETLRKLGMVDNEHKFIPTSGNPPPKMSSEQMEDLCFLQEALYYRGRAYEQLTQLDDAIRDFSEVMSLDHSSSFLFVYAAYARASCHNMQGNFDAAIYDYELALQRDGDVALVGPSTGYDSSSDTKHTPGSDSRKFSNPAARLSRYINGAGGSREEMMMQADGSPFSFDKNARGESKQSTTPGQSATSARGPAPQGLPPRHPTHPQAAQVSTGSHSRSSSRDNGLIAKSRNELARKIASTSQPRMLSDNAPSGSSVSGSNSAAGLSGESDAPTTSSQPGSSRQKGNPQQEKAIRLHALGVNACKNGDFESAIAYYNQAIESWPAYFKAHFNKGYAFHHLGRIEQAIESYSAAIAASPENAFAYYNRGIAVDRMGDCQRAIEDFSKAIKLASRDEQAKSPKGVERAWYHNLNPDFFHNRGYVYKRLGMLPEAINDYNIALSLRPNHYKACINRGLSFEMCADDLESDASSWKEGMDVHIPKYQIHVEELKKKHEAAVNRFNEEKDGSPPTLTVPSLEDFRHQQCLEACIRDYTFALRVKPHSVFTLESRCLALQRLKRYGAAVKDISKAILICQAKDRKLKEAHKTQEAVRAKGLAELQRAGPSAATQLAQLEKSAAAQRATERENQMELCGIISGLYNIRGVLWSQVRVQDSPSKNPVKAVESRTDPIGELEKKLPVSVLQKSLGDFTLAMRLLESPRVLSIPEVPGKIGQWTPGAEQQAPGVQVAVNTRNLPKLLQVACYFSSRARVHTDLAQLVNLEIQSYEREATAQLMQIRSDADQKSAKDDSGEMKARLQALENQFSKYKTALLGRFSTHKLRALDDFSSFVGLEMCAHAVLPAVLGKTVKDIARHGYTDLLRSCGFARSYSLSRQFVCSIRNFAQYCVVRGQELQLINDRMPSDHSQPQLEHMVSAVLQAPRVSMTNERGGVDKPCDVCGLQQFQNQQLVLGDGIRCSGDRLNLWYLGILSRECRLRIAEVLGHRAFLLRSLGRLREAIRDYWLLLVLVSVPPNRCQSDGSLAISPKESKESEQQTSWGAVDPSELSIVVTTLHNLAYVHAQLQQYDQAVLEYSNLLYLEPQNVHAFFNRAVCHEKAGFFVEAVADFTRVIKLSPNYSRAYRNRAAVYKRVGKMKEAEADMQKALELQG